MGVFFIRSVSVTIFSIIFLPKPPEDQLANRSGPPVVRRPQFEKHWSKASCALATLFTQVFCYLDGTHCFIQLRAH
jgi:hypothetical protein